MKPSGAHQLLERDGEPLSWVSLPDMAEDQAAPAVVRFAPESGVTVKLLDAPKGWPTQLGGRSDLVVHGASVEGGYPFSVLYARVSRVELGHRPRTLSATTLALGRISTWIRSGRRRPTGLRTYTSGWAPQACASPTGSVTSEARLGASHTSGLRRRRTLWSLPMRA